MMSLLYKFAFAVGILTFIYRIYEGNSIINSLGKSAVVSVGILFTFYIAGHLLKFGISATTKEVTDENEVTEDEPEMVQIEGEKNE